MTESPRSKPIFAEVKTKDLNGKTYLLPRDFGPGKVCLIVAFEREQQAECDRIAALYAQIDEPLLPRLIEVPVIDDPGIFMRWFILQGMKGGVREHARRAQVFTIYVSLDEWKRSMNITNNAVYLVGTDSTGFVEWMQPADEVKTKYDLAKLLRPGPTA